MSTRSTINIQGKSVYGNIESAQVYRHSDGYPTSVLKDIREALIKSITQVETNAKRLKESTPMPVNVSQLVGNFIGVSTSEYGMNAELISHERSGLPKKFDEGHWDLEWVYVLNLEDKTLKIYTSNKNVNSNKTTNPVQYTEQLKVEFQDDTKKKILSLVNDIEMLGFKINPKKNRKTKPVKLKAV